MERPKAENLDKLMGQHLETVKESQKGESSAMLWDEKKALQKDLTMAHPKEMKTDLQWAAKMDT
jgi:hypothetical protein